MRLGILAFILAVATAAHADLAVSIRYFKTEGVSHYHLFLYRDDGTLVRQLTAAEDAQDTAPMFSGDGKEIYFTREQHGKRQTWSLRPDGAHLHVVEKAPAGYPPQASNQAYAQASGSESDSLWQTRGDDLVLKTPDGKQEIVLKAADNYKHLDPSFEGIGFKALVIRDPAGGSEVRVPTEGDEADDFCELALLGKSPFLIAPGLRIAFYWQWQGSTAGPRLGALDLANHRAVFLSQNPAVAIPHGARAGFFSVCEDRYQPLGDTGHTVNCLYLDWWDAKLQRTRFANAISLFGGASVRVPGQPQLDISGKD